MRAAELLSQQIMLGKIEIGAVGGMESMTNTPYYLYGARKGYRLGNAEQVIDGLMKGGLIVNLKVIIWGLPPKISRKNTALPVKSRMNFH